MERDVFKSPEVGDAYLFLLITERHKLNRRVVITHVESRGSVELLHWSFEDWSGAMTPQHPAQAGFLRELVSEGGSLTYLGKDHHLVDKAKLDAAKYYNQTYSVAFAS